jgi:hypothetical protein
MPLAGADLRRFFFGILEFNCIFVEHGRFGVVFFNKTTAP